MITVSILLIHAAAAWFMTGLIWFVQIVHYPLFDRVGAREASKYCIDNRRLTTFVVVPVMLFEGAMSAALVWLLPATLKPAAWAGVAMLLALWVSTAVIHVPQHARLGKGFDASVHRRLVASNWLRTTLWTARGIVALWLVAAH
jgi:uncharacterized membrane protein